MLKVPRLRLLIWIIVLSACSDDTKPSSDMESYGAQHDSGTEAGDTGALLRDGGSMSSAMDACADCAAGESLPHTTGTTYLKDAGDGWQELALADWKLGGGKETYLCLTVTAPRDT